MTLSFDFGQQHLTRTNSLLTLPGVITGLTTVITTGIVFLVVLSRYQHFGIDTGTNMYFDTFLNKKRTQKM